MTPARVWWFLGMAAASSAAMAQPVPAGSAYSVDSSTGKSVIVGDALWLGKLSVGSRPGSARMDIRSRADLGTAFRVAGVDETPFLEVSSGGWVGAGVKPSAMLDVEGWASPGDFGGGSGLAIRNSASVAQPRPSQMALAAFGTRNFRHLIRTEIGTSVSGDELQFFLWSPEAGGIGDPATEEVLSLHMRRDGVTVHILPVGFAYADLVVSDGVHAGMGLVHRRNELVPAGPDLQQGSRILGGQDGARAYQEENGVRYGYSARGEPMPVFDTVPLWIRRDGGFVSLDDRITEAELAAQELILRLEKTEDAAKDLEARP